ncbi:hypothetical protein GCM10007415_30980 [Parapedobacter pyrenivorans]|uniref:DUF4397 domain-containing protein n=1 Tax=Parapedobacter pyrenivorans TaxID=1305674 RepID=A0A917MC36_9SPHI|nr:DUF4397 domain-containing protein [Parapedobacter pyrenivorans]GGG93800.1 hypothetical protein GCM10007415_30980 [Parapedobacter pyrenivorans]
MKKLSLIVAVVASVGLLGSCLKGGDPQPERVGGMTFINTFIESNGGVYYYVDRNTIQGLNPLPYRSYGPQWPVYIYPGEARRLEIYSTYQENRLVDTALTVQDSVYYSSIVYGTHDDPRHFVTEDRIPENVDDPQAIAAVRFFNLANSDHRITLRIGDIEPVAAFRNRPLETPQTGKAGEAFIPVATGTYTLSVVDEEGETVATRQGTVDLPAGSYTSVFLTGDERDASTFYVGVVRQWVN